MVNPSKLIKHCFLVYYSFVDLMGARQVIGFWSYMFWAPVSQNEVLKVRDPVVGSSPFTSQEEAEILSSLLVVWSCPGVGFMRNVCLSVSYPF